MTDFGIGGLAAQPVLERSRSSSSLMGNMASVLTGSYSPLYASPQQVRGDKPDPRDDVYALGVIWYQLLACDLTIPAPTGRRWVDDLLKRGISDGAVELLSSCFETAPAHRPDDFGVLFERLQAIESLTSTKPAGSTTHLLPAYPEYPLASEPSNDPNPQTVKAEPRPPKPTKSLFVSPAPHIQHAAPFRISDYLWPAGNFRRWAVAGGLGMTALLVVILYVTTVTVPQPTVPNDSGPSQPTVRSPAQSRPKANSKRPATADSTPPVPRGSGYITTRTGQIMLKLIPAGTFQMGSPNGRNNVRSNEKPQHQVRITQPFYLGVYEVTRGQFRQFVDDAGYETEAEKDGKTFWVLDEKTKKKFGEELSLHVENPWLRSNRRASGRQRELERCAGICKLAEPD